MTHGAAMGLIAARDFVDIVVNVNTDEFVGTLGTYAPTPTTGLLGFTHW